MQVPIPPSVTAQARLRALTIVGAMAVAVLTVLGLLAAAYVVSPHQIRVVADGVSVVVPAKSTVEDLRRLGYLSAKAGDLVSEEGSVTAIGGGRAAAYSRNGRVTSREQILFDGDVVASAHGANVVERTIETTAEIEPPVVTRGDGPLISVEESGSPGVLVTKLGEVSRTVLSTEVAQAPKPMIVARRTPRVSGKLVALTFDDGPWPDSTRKIIAILKKEGVPATFFQTGVHARRYPWIARDVGRAGFDVGSHGMTHKRLTTLASAQIRSEILVGKRTVERLAGDQSRWFRPAYGSMNSRVLREVKAEDLLVARWTVDSGDWDRPGTKRIINNVVPKVRPGGIILMHDGGGDRTQTVAALTRIIRGLKKRGYTFVTLDELRAASR